MTRRAPISLLLAGILPLYLLAGCVQGYGTNFSTARIPSLVVGQTTKRDVASWFGEPESKEKKTINETDSEILYFYFQKQRDYQRDVRVKEKDLRIELHHDTVRAFFFNSSFREDSTEFDSAIRDKVVKGNDSKPDVNAKIGKPSGCFQFPSNLFQNFGKMLRDSKPDSAFDAWVYCNDYYSVVPKTEGRYFRILVLYFNQQGLLIEKAYAESLEPRK